MKVRRILLSVAIALGILAGLTGCPGMAACDDGSRQKGGKPREGTEACDKRKENRPSETARALGGLSDVRQSGR